MFFESSLTLVILDLFPVSRSLGFFYIRGRFLLGPLSFHEGRRGPGGRRLMGRK